MEEYIGGIDIGGTAVKFGIFDSNKTLVYKTSRPSVLNDPDKMACLIKDMLDEAPYRVSRLGVGTPGTVLLPECLVTAINLGWDNAPLRTIIADKLGIPVWVDNDAQTQLCAEWWTGACQGLSSVVYLSFGTGVGGALLLNSKPWRGHRNTAGELGHFVTHADGLLCPCGIKGCYEMYASAGALCRMAKRDNAKEIFDAVRAGDPEMTHVLHAYLHEVAIGIASLYMVFCPQAIVLGGGISASGDIMLSILADELRTVANESKTETILSLLRLAVHRNDAGITGAAALAVINL